MAEKISSRTYKPGDPVKVYFELSHSNATSVQIGFELEGERQPDSSLLSVGFDVGDPLPIAKSSEKQTIMSEGRIPDKIAGGLYALYLHFESEELNNRYLYCGVAIRIESDHQSGSLPGQGDIGQIDIS